MQQRLSISSVVMMRSGQVLVEKSHEHLHVCGLPISLLLHSVYACCEEGLSKENDPSDISCLCVVHPSPYNDETAPLAFLTARPL